MSFFMEDWELAKGGVELSRVVLDMPCQELNGPWQLVRRCHKALCHSKRSLSHTVRCDKNGEGCGERMKERRNANGELH